MSDSNDEVYLLFLEEARDHLENIEGDLLRLEEEGVDSDPDLINKIFRDIHTVKGGAGFFNLTDIQSLAHILETILGQIRERTRTVTSSLISDLLEGGDVLRHMVQHPESKDYRDSLALRQRLGFYLSDFPEDSSKNDLDSDLSGSKSLRISIDGGNNLLDVPYKDIMDAQRSTMGAYYIYLLVFNDSSGVIPDSGGPFVELTTTITTSEVTSRPFAVVCATVLEPDIFHEYIDLPSDRVHTLFRSKIEDEDDLPQNISIPMPRDIVVKPSADLSVDSDLSTNIEQKGGVGGRSVRISLSALENLMTLAGELVLTRNELLQKVGDYKEFSDTVHRVDDITTLMQEAIMATRMQSVGGVLSKFKRVVRDLSSKLGKEIDLTIVGEDVELDRTIVEAIGDPLTHLVRNSVDHGIEPSDIRVASSKSPRGKLIIKAEHRAGQVIISIADDGAGIDIERVKRKALENGLYPQDQLDSMSIRDIQRIIFMPGFSTAEQVSDVSGRGVGMDVVIKSLADVGGSVDIDSKEGLGTTIEISLPLTLAIIPGLLVSSGADRFVIPQIHVFELVRVPASKVKDQIKWFGDNSVLSLRGDLLPLLRLTDVLNHSSPRYSTKEGDERVEKRKNIADRRSPDLFEERVERYDGRGDRRVNSILHIAVVSSGSDRFGLVVDSFLDSEEIVVKPLGSHLKTVQNYAGATILGDGRVALIIDIDSVKRNSLTTTSRDLKELTPVDSDSPNGSDRYSLLTFYGASSAPYAVPMDLVRRIEEIDIGKIQSMGGRRGIPYRGDTLPLISLDEFIPKEEFPRSTKVQLVVFSFRGRELGLICSKTSDIIQKDGVLDGSSYTHEGVWGTLVIDNHITKVLDLYEVGRKLYPQLSKEQAVEERRNYTVLIVDDSPFFLKQLSQVVSEGGYSYLTASDGAEGLALFYEKRDSIDLIITDVEMPKMTGVELTSALRRDYEKDALPIIACTTLSDEKSREIGLDVGVNEYLIKVDKEEILEKCRKYLR